MFYFLLSRSPSHLATVDSVVRIRLGSHIMCVTRAGLTSTIAPAPQTTLWQCCMVSVSRRHSTLTQQIPQRAAVSELVSEPLCPLLTPCTLRSQLQIRWDLVSEAVPAFVTIAVMPLTYSIAYGVPGVCAF